MATQLCRRLPYSSPLLQLYTMISVCVRVCETQLADLHIACCSTNYDINNLFYEFQRHAYSLLKPIRYRRSQVTSMIRQATNYLYITLPVSSIVQFTPISATRFLVKCFGHPRCTGHPPLYSLIADARCHSILWYQFAITVICRDRKLILNTAKWRHQHLLITV